ncbi:BZ3500_MvSof-1268-A1-R1_Chr2-1g04402 [Microbotryum saponariae]|uniref:BZ3500_MvSof-1268-A1-R1_Chr2-1g04402 protein n=1 Tax=Microbotryum saponariae TaxID=289078 RepID=A0A2X0MBB7_9BASI|nr:BZ3500_MvSof-1268-A1-R1_Chr2-1g04402 [Microbotryum saponariae]SCZ91616.1 BZ3501_MvSof-1269-A2-R1_Chr2-1g04058 [Microbotryum saponariae]
MMRFTLPSTAASIPGSGVRRSLDNALTVSFGRAGRTQGYTLMKL